MDGLRASFWRAAWLRGLVRGLVGYLMLWGVVTLVGRAWLSGSAGGAGGWPSGWWAWGGLGLALVAVGSAIVARRGVPGGDVAKAMLDRRRALGGLLMADGHDGFSAWSGRVSGVEPLRVRWRGGPAWGALGVSAMFLLGAGFVPMSVGAGGLAGLNVERNLSYLEEQIAVLEEESVIDASEADALRDDAAKVADEAEADDPVRTWEALDHLAEQLQREGAEARERAMQDATEAGAAVALAEAVRMADGGLTEAQMAGAMEALEQLMGEALNGEVPPWVQDAMAGAMELGLDAEALEKLREMMEGREAELAELMDALREAGLG